MQSFLKWTATIAAISAGGVMIWNAVQAGRQRMKSALGRAEGIADSTRQTLEETQSVLHDLRTSM